MAFGDVVDELHDEHRLAHTGTAEQSDLTTLHIGLQQVNYFDTRRENLLLCGELFEFGSLAMDGVGTFHV